MQHLDEGTVRECFNSSDELYEVLRLTTQAGAYEVVQTIHDGLHQYIVVQYRYDRDVNLGEQSFSLDNIVGGELFTNPNSAKLRVMEFLTHANLTA